MEFTSEWTHINAAVDQVFNFTSDLNNLGKLMPDQVINWKATADSCSFTIQGMAEMHLRVMSRIPHSYIGLVPEGKSPIDFKLDIDFKPAGENSEARVKLEAHLNPMLAMVAKRPLQNLVNIMAQKLSSASF